MAGDHWMGSGPLGAHKALWALLVLLKPEDPCPLPDAEEGATSQASPRLHRFYTVCPGAATSLP